MLRFILPYSVPDMKISHVNIDKCNIWTIHNNQKNECWIQQICWLKNTAFILSTNENIFQVILEHYYSTQSFLLELLISLQTFCYLPIKNKKVNKWLTMFNLHSIYSAMFLQNVIISLVIKDTLLKERV